MLLSQWISYTVDEVRTTTFYGVKQWEVNLESVALSSNSSAFERSGEVAGEPVASESGYAGPLAPDLSGLGDDELIAVLSDASADNVDRSEIAAAVNGDLVDTRVSRGGLYDDLAPGVGADTSGEDDLEIQNPVG